MAFRTLLHLAAAALLLQSAFFRSAQPITHPIDIHALTQLKASVNSSSISPTSCLGSWDFSFDPCDFSASTVFVCGLRCDSGVNGTDKRVVSISLVSAGYRGTVSPYIGNLTAIVLLDLSGNAFHGSIPDTLRLLTSLELLDLSRNSLSGVIPQSVGALSNLQHLSLSDNGLQGSLPSFINSLTSLQTLYIDGNLFSGSLPALSSLTRLSVLDASENKLSGSIPLDLPRSLNQLSLRNNQLGGGLPLNLKNMPLLEVLDLRFNNITGSLGTGVLTHPSLQQVNISYNRLTTLDATINNGVNSQLAALDLSFNQIQGTLPVSLASLGRLTSLSLRYNHFRGAIPVQYGVKAAAKASGDNHPFTRLFLDGNYLSGPIPAPFFTAPPGLSASFVDNCLKSCPGSLAYCEGGGQKSEYQCKVSGPTAY